MHNDDYYVIITKYDFLEEKLMKIALTIALIVVAVALAIIVLSQEGKEQGFTGSFTGAVDTYWGKNKKHSREARIQRATAILGALFIILAAILSSKWV